MVSGPQRAGSLLMAFAVKAYKVGTAESNIRNVDIHNLLGPCARVVEQTKNCIISPSVACISINLAEDVCHLLPLQVIEYRTNVALERNAKNRLAVSQKTWIQGGQITEEGVDTRQPRIARPN